MIIDREKGMVAMPWCIEDVRAVIEDQKIELGRELTDDECFMVLVTSINKHDSNDGLNWDVLAFWVKELYLK